MYKKYNMKIDGKIIQVELQEIPYNPLNRPFLSVNNGHFYKGTEKKKFITTNFVGYAVTHSTKDDLARELDRIKDLGCDLVRVLHIGGYQPTYNEVEQAWDKLDIFIDLLTERDMYMWYNLQHRQRLNESDGPDTRFGKIELWNELWGPRPAGIFKGEINDLFFWDDVLMEIVKDHSIKFISRYRNNPTVSVVTLANEKTATRSKGYWVGDRTGFDTNAYKKAWFKFWDSFNTSGLKGTKSDIAKFQSSMDVRGFSILLAGILNAGYKGIKNSTSFFGDSNFSLIPGMRVCDFVDFHLYPESSALPDPLSPSTNAYIYRTFGSVAGSLHLENMPLTCSEWASVYQQGSLKSQFSDSLLTAPEQIAKWFIEQDMSAICQYAAYSAPIGESKASVYDAFKTDGFFDKFAQSCDLLNTYSVNNQTNILLELNELDLYGEGIGTSFSIPIPGNKQLVKDYVKNKVKVITKVL